MKLITKAIEKITPNLYESESVPAGDKKITAKFFTPWTNWTWYMAEYDPKDRLAFGYVKGPSPEWGYFSLDELESINGPFGLKIERDTMFTACKFSEIK